jgi:hypothetical protein
MGSFWISDPSRNETYIGNDKRGWGFGEWNLINEPGNQLGDMNSINSFAPVKTPLFQGVTSFQFCVSVALAGYNYDATDRVVIEPMWIQCAEFYNGPGVTPTIPTPAKLTVANAIYTEPSDGDPGTVCIEGDVIWDNNVLVDVLNICEIYLAMGIRFEFANTFTAASVSYNVTVDSEVYNTGVVPIKDIDNPAGNTYTLISSDKGKYLRVANAVNVTIVIPDESSVPFPTGTVITFEQKGAGDLVFDDTAITPLNSFNGFNVTSGQYVGVQLIKVGSDTWTLIGALE